MLSATSPNLNQIAGELKSLSDRKFTPFERIVKLVEWAQERLPWGQKPLEAAVGLSQEDVAKQIEQRREAGSSLATLTDHKAREIGGRKPELEEAVEAKLALDKCITEDPHNIKEQKSLRGKMEEEFADLVMMILAWGRKIGINLNQAFSRNFMKHQKRFENVINVARKHKIEAQALKQNPSLFNKIWGLVKEFGAKAFKQPLPA